jgi:hypothetical protein
MIFVVVLCLYAPYVCCVMSCHYAVSVCCVGILCHAVSLCCVSMLRFIMPRVVMLTIAILSVKMPNSLVRLNVIC